MRTLLESTFDGLRLGAPRRVGPLVFFPLVGLEDDPPVEYLVLDRALAEGLVRIGEVSEGGSVPELRVENLASRPVLVVDGEELVGARQNRVLNATLLLAPHSVTVVPVSCVERGRWGYRERGPLRPDAPPESDRLFQSSERVHFAKGRAARMAGVARSRSRGAWTSEQGSVWSDVAEMNLALHVRSDTDAMGEAFDRYRRDLDAFVEALGETEPGQRGAVAALGGRIAGLELFDAADTYRTLAPKIVRSYALDALRAGAGRAPERADAELFVAAVRGAQARSTPSVGLGEDVRLDAPSAHGGALAHGGRLVHLAAFDKGWS